LAAVVVAPLTLAQFTATTESDAHGVLDSCLGLDRWVLEDAAGRPHTDWESLRAKPSGVDELRKIAALRLPKAITR